MIKRISKQVAVTCLGVAIVLCVLFAAYWLTQNHLYVQAVCAVAIVAVGWCVGNLVVESISIFRKK